MSRQVLAEPEAGPARQKTWARLADGTPLVTADRRGPGTLVLFHISADSGWSNLPLSGLFVDMLKRIVDRAGIGRQGGRARCRDRGVVAAAAKSRRLRHRSARRRPAPSRCPPRACAAPDADHPAGLYGAAAAPRALNAFNRDMKLAPLDFASLRLRLTELAGPRPVDLRPPLLIGAFLLALADMLAMLWLGGALAPPGRRRPSRGWPCCSCWRRRRPSREHHRPSDIQAAFGNKLAYVITGDSRVDRISGEGLYSLSETLARRTSFVPSEPQGIDPARDELSFYPLIYWPIAPDRPQPGPEVARRIEAYMKQGGLVLFDTRDAGMQFEGGPPTPGQTWLKTFLKDIDLPPLEPTPRDHVVTKTFYLLESFVGRTENGATYIEALPPDTEKEGRPARARRRRLADHHRLQ